MKDEVIKQLADKLGVAVDALWGALLKQAPITATASALGFLVLLCLATAGWYFCWRLFKAGNQSLSRDGADGLFCGSFIVGIVSALITITCLISLSDCPMILAGFFNPEYWALKQIIR